MSAVTRIINFCLLSAAALFVNEAWAKPDASDRLKESEKNRTEAYREYYRALRKSGSSDPATQAKLKSEILEPALQENRKARQQQRDQYLDSVKKKGAEELRAARAKSQAKATLERAQILKNSKESDVVVEAEAEKENPAPAKPVAAKADAQVAPDSKKPKEGWVLDGSNIPKVIEFPGKK